MKNPVQIIGVVALLVAFLTPLGYFAGMAGFEANKTIMLVATIVWFVVGGLMLATKPSTPSES